MKKRINNPREQDEQEAFVEYCTLKSIPVSASMNGMFLNKSNAKALIASYKKQGMSPGFPDLFIPISNGEHLGLFVEMKRGDGGVVSALQKKWIDLLNNNGYLAIVCNGAWEAIEATEKYLKDK